MIGSDRTVARAVLVPGSTVTRGGRSLRHLSAPGPRPRATVIGPPDRTGRVGRSTVRPPGRRPGRRGPGGQPPPLKRLSRAWQTVVPRPPVVETSESDPGGPLIGPTVLGPLRSDGSRPGHRLSPVRPGQAPTRSLRGSEAPRPLSAQRQ
eukprot:72769-Hanusia_phi.AAC.3